jgi:hypothetical protein
MAVSSWGDFIQNDGKMTTTWIQCKKLNQNDWLDLEKNIKFSLNNNWTNSSSRESFFISSKQDFLYNNRWNLNYVLQYYGEILGKEVVSNQEIVYKDLPELEKFKGSKVLIVGGGPTANQTNWNSQDYDYVFSCNHFYLNEKLNSTDVALATFTTETDFSEANTELHRYLENNSTIVCFEDRFQPNEREYFQLINNKFPGRAMFAHTRYRGKIGAVPRLVCIASLLGCREIHVVGLDGLAKGNKIGDSAEHSFQKGKIVQGTADYDLYRRHYVAFWDYILNDIGKNIRFQNLGEGHKNNMTTDISIQTFPLERKMNNVQDIWVHPNNEKFYCGGRKAVEFYNSCYDERKNKYETKLNNNHDDKINELKINGFTKWEQVIDHDLLDLIKDKVDYCIKNNVDLKSIDQHYATIANPFLVCNEAQQIAFSDLLVDFATNYFECMPAIGTFNLRRSFLNNLQPTTTQLLHRDKNSIKFFKFFVYLNDVEDSADGPLTIVKDSWSKMPHFHENTHRWEQRIKNLYGEDSLMYLTAKKGDLLAASTTSFHRGTKPTRKERTMLTLNFGIHPELQDPRLPNLEQLFKIKQEQYNNLPDHKKPVADFLIKV